MKYRPFRYAPKPVDIGLFWDISKRPVFRPVDVPYRPVEAGRYTTSTGRYSDGPVGFFDMKYRPVVMSHRPVEFHDSDYRPVVIPHRPVDILMDRSNSLIKYIDRSIFWSTGRISWRWLSTGRFGISTGRFDISTGDYRSIFETSGRIWYRPVDVW